jgi:methylenetetrahydrofolate dehydrogenase (NADP+)/methenyltetrahydrofolate cyclohydrolase
MSAKIIDGKAISAIVNQENLDEINRLKAMGIVPGLAVILVGEDPASQLYVNSKVKKCQELGINSQKYVLDKEATMEELLELIDKLNNDDSIHGILVQSPPPPQIDEEKVVEAILPSKDVDCFHAENVGKMLIGKEDGFFPCTPYGVMILLEKSGIEVAGKHAVIIGRSNIVGKPMMALLVQKNKNANATVTCVHSATRNLKEIVKTADIVVAAIGKPEFVTADMIKEDAVVIDVGINRVADAASPKGYKVVGDVKYDEVAEVASYITPVPGGVGPMTIAILMKNTINSCKRHNKIG